MVAELRREEDTEVPAAPEPSAPPEEPAGPTAPPLQWDEKKSECVVCMEQEVRPGTAWGCSRGGGRAGPSTSPGLCPQPGPGSAGCSSRQLPGTAGLGEGGREGQGREGTDRARCGLGQDRAELHPPAVGSARGAAQFSPAVSFPVSHRVLPCVPSGSCSAQPRPCTPSGDGDRGAGPPGDPQLPPCWDQCSGPAALSVSRLCLSPSPRRFSCPVATSAAARAAASGCTRVPCAARTSPSASASSTAHRAARRHRPPARGAPRCCSRPS